MRLVLAIGQWHDLFLAALAPPADTGEQMACGVAVVVNCAGLAQPVPRDRSRRVVGHRQDRTPYLL